MLSSTINTIAIASQVINTRREPFILTTCVGSDISYRQQHITP